VLFVEKGSVITLRSLIVRTPANARVEAKFDTSVQQTTNWIRGNPTKSHASWDGATLRIASSYTFDGAIQSYQEEWTANADGTLTLVRNENPAPVTKVVFEKQPADAAAEFDKPEKTAREAYKNVQMLNVPASSVLPIMNTYCLSLGVSCAHCHVAPEWDKDDKPAKATARKMIVMTRALNQENFSPRVGASCYTCHRGNVKPALVPPE
jgi:hypothetical protein